MRFCHLHLHNEYSVLDGIGSSKQFAELAKAKGQTHLAISNHGNIDGALAHQKACREVGIKPLIGCELYIVPNLADKPKGETRYHITVLVENQIGWVNLLKMLTIANLDGFYSRPRIDPQTLLAHLNGLVVLSGCSMSFLGMPGGREFLQGAIDKIGKERVFLEIMPHDFEPQIKLNKRIKKLAEVYGLELVATNDCHYPTAESAMHQEVLLAIQSRKTWEDKTRWKFSFAGLHLKDYEEMFDAFVYQDCFDEGQIKRAMRNSVRVAKICEGFEIKQQPIALPGIGLDLVDEEEHLFLWSLICKGKQLRLPNQTAEQKTIYDERIVEEFTLIKKMGFQKYFLIVWDLITWCRKNDVMVGPGRGSVGGSLIAYLLGITDVDPIEFDLVFFRFISPDRSDLPDIDLDFEDHKRPLVRKYLSDKYGEHNVAGLSTFMTIRGKGALRDVARVFDVPLSEVDKAAKAMDDALDDKEQIKTSFSGDNEECNRFRARYPKVVEVAQALEGQIRGVGQHAAAVCISSQDLRKGRKCNLAIRSNTVVANWDKENAEYMGLMKLDVLGLSALSVLNESRKMIKINHGIDIVFQDIRLDDEKVFSQINKGDVAGAFQISAKGLSGYCQELGIDNFELLSAATALFRPGPLHSGMAERFIKRKHGREAIEKIHPIYDEITKNTLGIIVYQEQVMLVINRLAGIPMNVCNKIRGVMAKSKGAKELNKYQAEFVKGCSEKETLTEKKAKEVWKTISTFGKYGFNRSHSVEYSVITYWDMWLKTYYPREFLACCLTFGNKDHFRGYIAEAKRAGAVLRLPKIGISDATSWIVDKDGQLFAPFTSINGIGDNVAKLIAEHKPIKGKGFFTKTSTKREIKGIGKTTLAILDKIGAWNTNQDPSPIEQRKFDNIFTF